MGIFFKRKKNIDTQQSTTNSKNFTNHDLEIYERYKDRIISGEYLVGQEREEYNDLGLKLVLEDRKNSNNPKFHRSDQERKLRNEFSQKNHSIIQDYENRICISDKADYNKLKSNLVAYDEFQKFCYDNGDGGKLYFQDMWEYCFNSKKECFSFKETILEYMQNYLDANRAVIDIIEILKTNDTYLQKDLKHKINYCTPQEIGLIIREMVDKDIIAREKYKNTYILKLKIDI